MNVTECIEKKGDVQTTFYFDRHGIIKAGDEVIIEKDENNTVLRIWVNGEQKHIENGRDPKLIERWSEVMKAGNDQNLTAGYFHYKGEVYLIEWDKQQWSEPRKLTELLSDIVDSNDQFVKELARRWPSDLNLILSEKQINWLKTELTKPI